MHLHIYIPIYTKIIYITYIYYKKLHIEIEGINNTLYIINLFFIHIIEKETIHKTMIIIIM